LTLLLAESSFWPNLASHILTRSPGKSMHGNLLSFSVRADSVRYHTSSHTSPEFCFPFDRFDDVAPSPKSEALRFATYARISLPAGAVRGTFQRGVFESHFQHTKTYYSNLNFAFPASASRKANKDTGTGKPGYTRGTFLNISTANP